MVEYVTSREFEDAYQRASRLANEVSKFLEKNETDKLLEALLALASKHRSTNENLLNYLSFLIYLEKNPEFKNKIKSNVIAFILRTALERRIKSVKDARKFVKELTLHSINYYRKREEFTQDVAWRITKRKLFLVDSWFIGRYRELQKFLNYYFALDSLQSTSFYHRLTSKLLQHTRSELALIKALIKTLKQSKIELDESIGKKLDELESILVSLDKFSNKLALSNLEILELLYLRIKLSLKLLELAESLKKNEILRTLGFNAADTGLKLKQETLNFVSQIFNLAPSEFADRLLKENFANLFRKRLEDLGITSLESFYLQFYELSKILKKNLTTISYEELYKPLFLEFLGFDASWLEILLR